MILIFKFLVFFMLAISLKANAENWEELKRLVEEKLKEPAIITRSNDVIYFKGSLWGQNISRLLLEFENGEPGLLIINSGGGHILGAIEIGEKINQLNMDVEVEELCASSCANYIFTAGKRKKINEGAVVIWHGDGQQKSFREYNFCKKAKSRYSGYVREVTNEEVEDGLKTIELEKQFYEKLGVSSYIARAAQEPYFYNRNVTYTVEDMRVFGVHNVIAVSDYGTAEFCARHNKENSGSNILCLPVSSNMLAYENARVTLGEVCRDDGSLVINSRLLN